jgi:glycosyltransferase involved in cell wall biosynthesis
VITILMPLDNFHADYLDAAFQSLQCQSVSTWCLLVIVEPDRRDELASVLDSYLRDDRVQLITNEGHGLAAAFNTGMRRAETNFVAILCADDMWEVDAVAVLERELEQHPTVDFFHSSRRIVDDLGVGISSVHRARDDVTLTDFETVAPVKHLLCWRRAMGLEIGGMDESLTVGPDDFDFPWLMAEHGAEFRSIHECLYVYRDHRSRPRLTTHLPRSIHLEQLTRVFRKHGLSASQVRQRIRAAKRTYLRKCLYRSRFEQRVKELFGRSAEHGWRDTYR